MSKAVVCWESDIVTAGSGCDSVDAISTMWTHTGYAPCLVTWQRFVHRTGYLLQHIRITEVRPASIVPPPLPSPDQLCIMCMLAETASEGDDIARYFDSLGPKH